MRKVSLSISLFCFLLSFNSWGAADGEFVNILYTVQFQDTFTIEGKRLVGKGEGHTGDWSLIGYRNGSEGEFAVRDSDAIESTQSRSLPRELIIGSDFKSVEIIDTARSIRSVVEATIKHDEVGRVSEFIIGAQDIRQFLDVAFLQEFSDFITKQYGFSIENSSVKLMPSKYRCYFRRKVVRCFIDFQYFYRTI